MDRYGLTIPLAGRSLAEHRAVVAGLADLGYTDVWSAEAGGADAFTPLALASVWAPTLRLGTAIVPAFTRGPATIAQCAGALAEAAPGRFSLGIGTSSEVIVQRWNGIPFDRPYQRVRDLVWFLRAALAGERITHEYETFTVDGFRLLAPPASPPRILVAALRPGMLRLAGREADGAILNWLSVADVGRTAPFVTAGGPDKEVVARIFVAPSSDPAAARVAARSLIAAYLTVPVYRAFHEWLGRGDLLAEMWRAWEAGDRKGAAAAVPDEVVDDLVVLGSPQECREHIARYVEAGVTTPVLALVPTGDDPAALVQALAPVRPTRDLG